MVPPEPVNKRRARRNLLRRRELVEEKRGFTNRKVSKKSVAMTCIICGTAGHNKRYHGGVQVNVYMLIPIQVVVSIM